MGGAGADDAELGEVGVRKAAGVVGGDLPGGDGHQADAVAAGDLQVLHRLKADLAVEEFWPRRPACEKAQGEKAIARSARDLMVKDITVNDCRGRPWG